MVVPKRFVGAVEQAVVELKQFRDCDEAPSPLISIIEDLEGALQLIPGRPHDVADLYEDDD